jgi:hypothetical protein
LAAGLIGCQKTPDASKPPAAERSATSASQAFPGTQSGSETTTSVPPVETGVAPATAKASGPAGLGRSNNNMSRAQESNAMPLPGQANDHSAPLAPDKQASRASAP